MKFCKNCVHWLDFPDKHKQMPAGKRKACTVQINDAISGEIIPHPKLFGVRTPARATCDNHRAKHKPFVKVKSLSRQKTLAERESESQMHYGGGEI